MTEDGLPLAEPLAKAGDGDFLSTIAESVLQLMMEADVEGVLGAGRHQWTMERATNPNGYSDRSLDRRLGPSQLQILKLRQGRYFALFLESGSSRGRRLSPSFKRPGSAASPTDGPTI